MCPPFFQSELVVLHERYVEKLKEGVDDEALASEIVQLIPQVNDPRQIEYIAKRLYDEYELIVHVDNIIALLRRWMELEPSSNDAKRTLGYWLYLHGPDWDEEAKRLMVQAGVAGW